MYCLDVSKAANLVYDFLLDKSFSIIVRTKAAPRGAINRALGIFPHANNLASVL